MTTEEAKSIQQQISKIKARNARVERDKAWETSTTRKILIMMLTYVVMVSFMSSIGVDKPFINALIPTTGFFLSTLTLRYARKIWEKYHI